MSALIALAAGCAVIYTLMRRRRRTREVKALPEENQSWEDDSTSPYLDYGQLDAAGPAATAVGYVERRREKGRAAHGAPRHRAHVLPRQVCAPVLVEVVLVLKAAAAVGALEVPFLDVVRA